MRSFATVGLVLCSLFGNSQDKVITLIGDTIHCRILEFNGIALTYKLSFNDSVCYMTSGKIYQLLYSDGQIQNVSQRVSVSGENDWEKVIISYDTAEVEGLVKVADLKATTRTYSTEEKALEKGEIKLKKEAAKMGAFLVLITYRYSRGMYTPILIRYNDAKSVYKATAYTYKK
jgi:hypothetical protein